MFNPELGVSLHMVGMPITERLLSALAASGVKTVELFPGLFGKGRGELDEVLLRETLTAMGARTASVHAPFGTELDLSSAENDVRATGLASLRNSVDLAERFGADVVVVHASAEPIPDQDRPHRLARATASLHSLSGRCEETGIRLAIELLPRSCIGNTVEELLAILRELDSDLFGVCLDVNHLMERYHELPDWVRALGPHLVTLHISDYDGVDEKHWLPGAGVIAWRPFMDALTEIGYSGPFNYESALPGETPEEKLAALEANFHALAGS